MLTNVTTHTGATVLVVEDDPDIREALCALLEDEGYNVYSAENGQTAACLLSNRPPPSVVITDLMMPNMDGWELIERLRKSDRLAGVPVVVISAVPPSQAPRGIRMLLRKPVNAGEVLQAVEHYAADQHA
jgi:CheY-like chemotaxis protein